MTYWNIKHFVKELNIVDPFWGTNSSPLLGDKPSFLLEWQTMWRLSFIYVLLSRPGVRRCNLQWFTNMAFCSSVYKWYDVTEGLWQWQLRYHGVLLGESEPYIPTSQFMRPWWPHVKLHLTPSGPPWLYHLHSLHQTFILPIVKHWPFSTTLNTLV